MAGLQQANSFIQSACWKVGRTPSLTSCMLKRLPNAALNMLHVETVSRPDSIMCVAIYITEIYSLLYMHIICWKLKCIESSVHRRSKSTSNNTYLMQIYMYFHICMVYMYMLCIKKRSACELLIFVNYWSNLFFNWIRRYFSSW